MPPKQRQTSATASAEALEKRAQTILDRVSARAQKEADAELESVRRVETNSWLAHDLGRVEAEVRELSHHQEELTEYGAQRLREVRAYRSDLRRRISEGQHMYERRARA